MAPGVPAFAGPATLALILIGGVLYTLGRGGLRRLEDDLTALSPARRPASVRSLHDRLRATHAA